MDASAQIRLLAPALVTIAARYGSILIVFVVLAILARRLSLSDYGTFILSYGVAATLYFAAGLGVPDGGVRVAAEALARGDHERAAGAARGILLSGLASLLSAVTVAAALALNPALQTAAAAALWAGAWAFLFTSSQALLALGRTRSAGLFFYAAGATSMLVTILPYALLARAPHAKGAILCAALGYGLAGLVGFLIALRHLRSLGDAAPVPLAQLSVTGLPFAATRIVQTVLIWAVPWAIAVFHGAAEAGLVATALRVAGAFGAALSALRFVLRPALVRLHTLADHQALHHLLQRVSLAGSLLALSAAVLMLLIGGEVLEGLFGPAFAAAKPFLVLALVALAGEGMTGLADDFVRITHRAGRVLVLQVALTALSITAVLALAPLGPLPAMAAYTAYPFVFCIISILWARNCLAELRSGRST